VASRSQWSRGLRRWSAAAPLLGLLLRFPPGAWMSVSCECCELSGIGLCVGLITHPEESYRLWCVVVCDREASTMRRPWPTWSGEPGKNKLLFNNQPDALINQIHSVIKLNMFRASSLPIIRSSLLYIRHW